MVSWTRADVVILTAIELEYAAVKLVEAGAAPGSHWLEDKHNGLPVALREFVGSGGRRLRIVVGRAPDMGKGSAVTTLLPLVDALRPSCIAMCGVCAGRPGKTALGDVVMGERLYDYDAGKWKEVGFEADIRTYSLPARWKAAAEQFQPKMHFGNEDWWQRRPMPYEWQENWVLIKLHEGIENPAALPECKDHCPQWSTVIENLWKTRDVKRNTRSLTKKGQKRAAGVANQYPQFPDLSPGGDFMPFQLHVLPIGSGSAVREDVAVWRSVTKHMRKAVALEMEASALAEIVRAREHHDAIKAVVMKGVMDFANDGRDDHFKHYAARASAECLIAFLRDQLVGGATIDDEHSAGGQALPGSGGDAPVTEAAAVLPLPPTPPATPPSTSKAPEYRFEVALSFAGDNKRDKVRAVAKILRNELGQGRVFFDEWFEAELAGFDAQVVLQNIYRKATRLVVTCVCKRYGEKPWTQEEWRAIQAFERGLRDAGSENLRRMRLLPLRFGDGEVDGLFETAIVPDVRERDPRAIADLILKRLREARGEREAVPPSPQESLGAPSEVAVRVDERLDRAQRMADATLRGEREAVPPSPQESSGAPSEVAVRVDERLDRAQRMVDATLRQYPLLRDRLTDRLDCAPAELARLLFAMRGLQLADLGAELYLELKPRSDSSADLKALESVIFTVLPHASDLRDQVARCPEPSDRGCDVVELTYRSRAIAEAVVAGWVGRACLFVKNSGKEPYGQGAIRSPVTTDAPLFMNEEHLRRDVVADLARQFKIERPNQRDLATAVNDWLDVVAVNDRRANEAVARANAGADLMRPVRYYYLFRDAEYAGERERDGWWDLVKAALHREGGLPRLVLVRMKGGEQSEENRLDYFLSEIVNKPEDDSDKLGIRRS